MYITPFVRMRVSVFFLPEFDDRRRNLLQFSVAPQTFNHFGNLSNEASLLLRYYGFALKHFNYDPVGFFSVGGSQPFRERFRKT